MRACVLFAVAKRSISASFINELLVGLNCFVVVVIVIVILLLFIAQHSQCVRNFFIIFHLIPKCDIDGFCENMQISVFLYLYVGTCVCVCIFSSVF